MYLSLLIPTYQLTEVECLVESLKALEIPDNAEVKVLDDASTNGCFEQLKESVNHDSISIDQLDENKGRSAIRNSLVKSIDVKENHWILFVDGDCSFDSDLLLKWIEVLKDQVNTSVVGRVRYKALEISSFSRYLDASSGPWSKDIERDLPHKYFATGHVAMPVDAFNNIKGFDENYKGWGGEDYDLGRRLSDSGVKLTLQKEVVVMHPPIQNVLSYFKRFKHFAETQLPLMRKEAEEEDFFGLNKFSKFPYTIVWAIPGLEKWFTRLLSVDDTPWPKWMYKVNIFLICYNGLKRAKKKNK